MQLPTALINSLTGIKGFDKDAFVDVHSSGEQVTSVRFNPAKTTRISKEDFFGKVKSTPVPWSSSGYYLESRPSFTTDPFLHAGAYYVQEASSMFLEEALKQSVDLSASLKILDLCAAPGGKSTLVQSLISENSLLVSNEVIKTRVNILAENIVKWGASNVMITNNDPRDFQRLQTYFDLIVVDAPCSGSGLFRKDPEAIREWSETNVQLCGQRQQRILADILPSLKDDGVLIYSTCSYSAEEDEQVADWLIGEGLASVSLQLQQQWGVVETQSTEHGAYGYRFYPDKIKGEGFYLAVFRKQGATVNPNLKQNNDVNTRKKVVKLSLAQLGNIGDYVDCTQQFFYISQNDEILAVPHQFEKDLALIQSTLYIKKAGIKLGSLIRQEVIPAHELALSSIIIKQLLSIDVDLETALQYLRKQQVQPGSGETGWRILTYKKLALGWIKLLSGRVNNYYPKEWRILHK